jgi:hypothetical protein
VERGSHTEVTAVAAGLEVAGGALSTEWRPRWKKRRTMTQRGWSSWWLASVKVLLGGKGWVAHQAQLGGVGCAGSPAVASCGQQSEACLVHRSFVRRRKPEESWPHREVVQG